MSDIFRIQIKKGPNIGTNLDLTKAVISMGRDRANDFSINSDRLAPIQARLVRTATGYNLENLSANNGTSVNGKTLTSAVPLLNGDEIELGNDVVLEFNRSDSDYLSNSSNQSEKVHAEEHRALFSRWFEELWNRKNYAITKELVDEQFTAHGAGGQDIKQGPDGVAGMVKIWHQAFPDGRMTMDDIITEGEFSTIRMTFRGTHTGDFYGVPASNKKVEVTSIGIDRVVNGKITEGWGELNMLGMMQQMGAIPSPDQGSQMNDIETNITPERVKEAYDALASGDIVRIRQYWADDMVWQVPGHNELSGWYYSLDEFLAFMGKVGEFSDHSFRMDQIAGQVLVTGDYSVDLTRNRGYRKGDQEKTMDIEVAHVLRWQDGKVIAGRGAIFGDGSTEYDQFWSRSPSVTPPTH
jgi:predicted ester cyclase/ketosteroid isomerase-like protein